MIGKGESGKTERPEGQDRLPPEILEIIQPALQVGGLSGVSGLVFGTFAGIVRSNTPVLFALASGIQWAVLGSTFAASRGIVLQGWEKERTTPRDRISASAIAGGIAGTAGGLLRGRRNVLPGMVMFALFGAAGQTLYNKADARNSELAEQGPDNTKKSWLDSKWSPMKVLSDSEYEDMLREKLLKINVEIAMVDDSIEAVRAQEKGIEAKQAQVESKGSK